MISSRIQLFAALFAAISVLGVRAWQTREPSAKPVEQASADAPNLFDGAQGRPLRQPHSDPYVRPTSHAAMLGAAAMAVGQQKAANDIIAIQQGNRVWKAPFPEPLILPTSGTFDLMMNSTADAKYTVTQPYLPNVAGVAGKVTIPQLEAGRQVLTIKKQVNDMPTNSTIVVHVPSVEVAAPNFSRTQIQTNPFVGNAEESADAEPATIYGDFLLIRGNLTQDNITLTANDFQVLRFDRDATEGTTQEYFQHVQPKVTLKTKGTEYFLTLKFPNVVQGANGEIVVATKHNNVYRVSAPFSFQIKKTASNLKSPEITSLRGTSDRSGDPEIQFNSELGFYPVVAQDFWVHGTMDVLKDDQPNTRIVLYRVVNGQRILVGTEAAQPSAEQPRTWKYKVELDEGEHVLEAVATQGSISSAPSKPIRVSVRSGSLSIVGIDPASRIFPPGRVALHVYFDPKHPLKKGDGEDESKYVVTGPDGKAANVLSAEYNPANNSVALMIADFGVENASYTLKVNQQVQDIFGTTLAADYEYEYFISDQYLGLPTKSRGITRSRGPNVEFPEYTEPRPAPNGANPSDKVVTHVVRLYYYRDAHRVAQIINREVQSFNAQGVSQAQHLADRSRREADTATDSRQVAEKNAVEAAQATRQAEERLEQLQQNLRRAGEEINFARNRVADLRNRGNLDPRAEAEIAERESQAQIAQSVAERLADSIPGATADVEQARNRESQTNEVLLRSQQREDRLREDQFRREVAANQEDPDTYAPGKPKSVDPVRRVSVSVIGEGLIQLRGPAKGINIIRKMVNEIDSPVGQVRVAVHTVQINGEHGDNMEDTAQRIQRYIDHSRFLTTHSAEMLRKSVGIVASQQAEQARTLYPGSTQEDRDHRYLYAFFGKDFIDELRAMDSEFLKTGNKVLSLHSMDTTSLANALFLLALASNQTRIEILNTFDRLIQSELPRAEQSYFESGMGGCKTCSCGRFGQKEEQFVMLSGNARFETFRGFFNTEYTGDETMSPVQREFVRLAQIFKSRLITELEFQQRVRERTVIEERLGDHVDELTRTRAAEAAANLALADARKSLAATRNTTAVELAALKAKISANADSIARNMQAQREVVFGDWGRQQQGEKATTNQGSFLDDLIVDYPNLNKANRDTVWLIYDDDQNKYFYYQVTKVIVGNSSAYKIKTSDLEFTAFAGYPLDPKRQMLLHETFVTSVSLASQIVEGLRQYRFAGGIHEEAWEQAQLLLRDVKGEAANHRKNQEITNETDLDYYALVELDKLFEILGKLQKHASWTAERLRTGADALLKNLRSVTSDFDAVHEQWFVLRDQLRWVIASPTLLVEFNEAAQKVDSAFVGYLRIAYEFENATELARSSRRPLDHKKFLDMFVDDLERKYVDLLEGTRAHVANIDNYVKRISTALESDFNTQFYFPAFRCVREASRDWDVTLGQVETTSILSNNRAFAKVSPQATMEFDLPRRDVLINEAMSAAEASVDAYGALVTDPTFLAMTRMNSGMPTSSPVAGAGGFSPVRGVLPGLETSTQEQLLNQQGPGQSQFNAAFESLIPDPAVYKFETGTGYEIRPVIQPDGQAVVFRFNYMYTTNVREPVRADEKHLGRVKRHFIDTDVQLSNYELREVSRYTVALKASRTARGVPLLEDLPVIGALWRPLPQQESSLQQNVIMAQATIYPTLFDLKGLRWAPSVADLDPLRLANQEFIVRSRRRQINNWVTDHSAQQVDNFLRIPETARRADLYRSQETVPAMHPNGYRGPGLDYRDSQMQEGYSPERTHPQNRYAPGELQEGSPIAPRRKDPRLPAGTYIDSHPLNQPLQQRVPPRSSQSPPRYQGPSLQQPIRTSP